MKIVILNNCFFNETHLEKLKSLGELTVFENTNSEELAIERLKNAEIAIADQFSSQYNSKVLNSATNLKLLALNTTTYSDVDIKSAQNLGISVANVPGFSKRSVAELTFGLIFAVARKIAYGDKVMKNSPIELDPENNEQRQQFLGYELLGKTLGILGLGTIGTEVAKIADAFGMNVIAYNRTPKNNGITQLTLNEVLRNSDIVTVHLSLNEDTKDFINTDKLALMKEGSLLVSTARPEITNIDDIYDALATNRLSGFAIDIGGKIKLDHPLLQLDNVVLTPHLGSFTEEAFYQNMPDIIVKNVDTFINGTPQNIVN